MFKIFLLFTFSKILFFKHIILRSNSIKSINEISNKVKIYRDRNQIQAKIYILLIYYNYNIIFNQMLTIVLAVAKECHRINQ